MKKILATRIDEETGEILRFLQKQKQYRGTGGKSAAIRDALRIAFGPSLELSREKYTARKIREARSAR
jgi:hypothetical protein